MAVILCFLFGYLFLFQTKASTLSFSDNPPLFSFSIDKIGQGALSLTSSKQKKILQEISQEVLLLTTSLKPGTKNAEVESILLLKSSLEQRKLQTTDPIYLSCEPAVGKSAPVYHFSTEKTPLWIQVLSVTQKTAVLEIGLCIPSKESESFYEEKKEWLLQNKQNI